MTDVVLVLTTVPAGSLGEEMALALVGEQLAACVSIGSPMTSVFRWKGTVERETECQLVIKTTRAQVPLVQERIAAVHPYEVPEFLVLPAESGSAAYLAWVIDETGGPGTADTR